MSGTSQAAPMVAGIAARCFATNMCKLGAADPLNKAGGELNTDRIIVVTANKNDQDPAYIWTDDKVTYVVNGVTRYYGPMVWANFW